MRIPQFVGLQMFRVLGPMPLVVVSPIVSQTLPVCVRLELLGEFTNGNSRWFILIGLYQPNNGNGTIMVLGQISKERDTYSQDTKNQMTLPAGTYRLLLASHNNAEVDHIVVKNINVLDGECTDDGE